MHIWYVNESKNELIVLFPTVHTSHIPIFSPIRRRFRRKSQSQSIGIQFKNLYLLIVNVPILAIANRIENELRNLI